MKFESARVIGVLTGTAAGFVLTACGATERPLPTDPSSASSAPSATWNPHIQPNYEQEVPCVRDGTAEGSIVFADPGKHNFVFTAPDGNTQHIAIGRLSAALTVYNPPVNNRDTHLTWNWSFPHNATVTATGDNREAQRHINDTTYIMNISPYVSTPGKPQLTASCLSFED